MEQSTMWNSDGKLRVALATLLFSASAGLASARAPGGVRADYLWNLFVPNAVPYSVAISDTTDETWLGQGFEDPRLTYLQTTGTGTPTYDFAFPDVSSVLVASAEDASLVVVATQEADAVTLYAFNDTSGANPLWNYTFPAPYNFLLAPHTVDVSDDGAFVLATAATDGPRMRIVRLDGATGAVLQQDTRLTWGWWVELSADGSRALLSELARTEIIETEGLSTLFTYQVPGPHNASARLSRDGMVAATGGADDFAAYRDTGNGWVQVYAGHEPFQYFWAVALSGDGDTLFVASFYTDWLRHTYRVIDLVNGVELKRIVKQGSGSFQDAIDRAEMSENGQVIAVASDGDEVNSHPELEVFDRDLNLIGGLDTPGSTYDMDMTRDGHYIVVGAKHVHWELPGSDGDAFAYRVPVAMPGDLNCDRVVDFADINPFVLALVDPDGYAALHADCDILNADINGDGLVDFSDINPFVELMAGVAPPSRRL
jgi:hypothetical protein